MNILFTKNLSMIVIVVDFKKTPEKELGDYLFSNRREEGPKLLTTQLWDNWVLLIIFNFCMFMPAFV